MTGPFNPPLVRVQENLTPDQKTRAAALLVAQQARPMATADEHLRLADYVVHGGIVLSQQEQQRSPMDLFGSRQMDLDPVHSVNRRHPEQHPDDSFDELDEVNDDDRVAPFPGYPVNPHANAPFEAP
jgi:hypothetical protein